MVSTRDSRPSGATSAGRGGAPASARATSAPARRSASLAAALATAVLAATILAAAPRAAALIVGGGGSGSTDCLSVFDADANSPVSRPHNIRCTDGDPCDADGVINGSCQFPVAVCVNSTFSAVCSLNGVETVRVEHAADNGDPKFDPEFQALQNRINNDLALPTNTADQCTTATNFHVAIKGPFGDSCRKNTKLVKLVTTSKVISGKIYTDKDKIKMTCDPAPTGCDPQVLFSGTFDRVQRQIFNQSCALSSCHDSQSQTGNLLLETGAAYTNLINVTPTNAAAVAAGWKRVMVIDAMTGDPATSLLYNKVIGPPPAFGARMPFDRKPLNQTLIDVIQLWIAAGAPETGWVPGTN